MPRPARHCGGHNFAICTAQLANQTIRMSNSTIEHLLKRRSVSANALGDPGPDRAQLEQILTAAARVPDHKKLAPWRFILFEGEARDAFGRVLAEVCREEEPEPSAIRLETEAKRFLRAPVVIAVISRVRTNVPVPEWEQVLSAGAACQNMVLAASALGFGVNWITECYASSTARRAPGARVAGGRMKCGLALYRYGQGEARGAAGARRSKRSFRPGSRHKTGRRRRIDVETFLQPTRPASCSTTRLPTYRWARAGPFHGPREPALSGWISTLDANGVVNLAPYSFFNAVSTKLPHFVMFSSGGRKDSRRNAEDTGEFVCSLATYDLRDAMDRTSSHVDPDVDENGPCGSRVRHHRQWWRLPAWRVARRLRM